MILLISGREAGIEVFMQYNLEEGIFHDRIVENLQKRFNLIMISLKNTTRNTSNMVESCCKKGIKCRFMHQLFYLRQ